MTTPSSSSALSQPMASVDIPDSPSTFTVLPGYENQLERMKVSLEVPENQPIQFVVFKCSKNSEVLLLGVHRKEARYLKFEYSNVRRGFKEHSCACQTPTMESDLNPLYAEWCEDLKGLVIHCKNSLNEKNEQYIVNQETENLVQVFRPELKFQEEEDNTNPIAYCAVNDGDHVAISRSSGGLTKMRVQRDAKKVPLPDAPVKKIDLTEHDDDVETIEIDVGLVGHFQDYLASLPIFKAWYCNVQYLMNVRVKVPNSNSYLDYHFENGSMRRSPECQSCSKEVTPESLIPKYSVKLDGFKHVLFCRNEIFETIEQYVLDSQRIALKQVFLPELLYDPTLVIHKDIGVLFIENGIQVSKEGLILIVKKLNRDTKHYEEVTNVPVRVMNQDSEASDAREEDVIDADRTYMEKLEELRGYPYQLFKCVYDEKHKEEVAKRRRSNQEKNANKKVAIVAGETDKEPKPETPKRSRQSQRKEGEKRGRPLGSTNRSRSSKSRKPATDLQEPQDQVHQDQEPQVQDPEEEPSAPPPADEPGKRSLRKRPEPTLVLKRTPTRSRSRKRKTQEPQKVQQPEDQLPVDSQMPDPAYQQQVFSPAHAPGYGNPGSDPSGYGNGNGYSYEPPQFSPGPNAVQDYLQASFNSPPPSHHYYHGPSGFPTTPYEQQQHYEPQYADIYGQGTSSDPLWAGNPFQTTHATSPMEGEASVPQNHLGYLPGGSEAAQQTPNMIPQQPTAEDQEEEEEDVPSTARTTRAQASETEDPGNPTSPAAGTGNSTPRSVSTEKGGYGTPVNDEPMAAVPISPRNGSQLPTSTGQSPNAPQTAQEPVTAVRVEQNYVPATLPASTIPFVGSMSYYGNGSSTAITINTPTTIAYSSALERIMAAGRNLPGSSTQQPSQGGSPEY